MMLCAAYIGLIIVIEAGPVYRLFMAQLRGKPLTFATWIWIIGSFAFTFGCSLVAIVLPMRYGETRLSKLLI
jgi:ABC-2 type transport system permease protein